MSHTNLHKELELIQNVIERMADNSFKLKGWALSLAVLVPALLEKGFSTSVASAVYLALMVVVVCFWYLDAWFLHRERCYRELYEKVRSKRLNSEGPHPDMYGLAYNTDGVKSVLDVMFSHTLGVFYAIPFLIVVFLLGLHHINQV